MSTATQRLSDLLLKNEGEAALLFSEVNRLYFTGFSATDGALLVTKNGSFLLMDFRYSEAASYVVKDSRVVEFSSMNETLAALLRDNAVKKVYLETEMLSVAQAKRFEELFEQCGVCADLTDSLDMAVKSLRTVKTDSEVDKIVAAQAITDAAFAHILPFIKAGVTEKEVALELEFYMRSHGAQAVSFDTIAVAGKNGSLCHGVPGDNKICDGDFLTLDFGALYDGYHADMTRTVAVGGVSEEQKEAYALVLKAQLAAIDAVRVGMPCCEVDKVARDILEARYPGKFGHGLGHGVGVEIHEWPRFSRLDKTPVAPGMVITVEPGVYLAGKFGVRIEDMIAVTPQGVKNLTKSPKELIIL